jgi:myosin-crossreactive antigen
MKKQAAHESNSYVVGDGIASLAAAALLIRDGDHDSRGMGDGGR